MMRSNRTCSLTLDDSSLHLVLRANVNHRHARLVESDEGVGINEVHATSLE